MATLNAYYQQGLGVPLLFLHGFLGDIDEWQWLCEVLPHRTLLMLDLPGHGQSDRLCSSDDGFKACCALIEKTVSTFGIDRFHLLGYSLGGRIALHYAFGRTQQIESLILEGVNLGLESIEARQCRLASDDCWAQRFATWPIEQTLEAWYHQELFSSLTLQERRELIARRSQNAPLALAQMLRATSLGHQANLRPKVKDFCAPILYVSGEKDHKFSTVGRELAVDYPHICHRVIANAGHNTHHEQPHFFAKLLEWWLQKCDGNNHD